MHEIDFGDSKPGDVHYFMSKSKDGTLDPVILRMRIVINEETGKRAAICELVNGGANRIAEYTR